MIKPGDNVIYDIQRQFGHLGVQVEEGKSVLIWPDHIPQREFLGLLSRLDAEGLTILQAGRREATLEEVFISLTSSQDPRP